MTCGSRYYFINSRLCIVPRWLISPWIMLINMVRSFEKHGLENETEKYGSLLSRLLLSRTILPSVPFSIILLVTSCAGSQINVVHVPYKVSITIIMCYLLSSLMYSLSSFSLIFYCISRNEIRPSEINTYIRAHLCIYFIIRAVICQSLFGLYHLH